MKSPWLLSLLILVPALPASGQTFQSKELVHLTPAGGTLLVAEMGLPLPLPGAAEGADPLVIEPWPVRAWELRGYHLEMPSGLKPEKLDHDGWSELFLRDESGDGVHLVIHTEDELDLEERFRTYVGEWMGEQITDGGVVLSDQPEAASLDVVGLERPTRARVLEMQFKKGVWRYETHVCLHQGKKVIFGLWNRKDREGKRERLLQMVRSLTWGGEKNESPRKLPSLRWRMGDLEGPIHDGEPLSLVVGGKKRSYEVEATGQRRVRHEGWDFRMPVNAELEVTELDTGPEFRITRDDWLVSIEVTSERSPMIVALAADVLFWREWIKEADGEAAEETKPVRLDAREERIIGRRIDYRYFDGDWAIETYFFRVGRFDILAALDVDLSEQDEVRRVHRLIVESLRHAPKRRGNG